MESLIILAAEQTTWADVGMTAIVMLPTIIIIYFLYRD